MVAGLQIGHMGDFRTSIDTYFCSNDNHIVGPRLAHSSHIVGHLK